MNSTRADLQPGDSAEVILLGSKTARLEGRVIDQQGVAIALAVPSDVPAGTAIQVICGDSMFLGEVRFCRPAGPAFTIGLDIEHALYDTVELARLAKQILDEA